MPGANRALTIKRNPAPLPPNTLLKKICTEVLSRRRERANIRDRAGASSLDVNYRAPQPVTTTATVRTSIWKSRRGVQRRM